MFHKLCQFGSKRSTIEPAAEMVGTIRYKMNNNESSCCVFLDLSKAFDPRDLEIILKKLEISGF